MDRTADSVADSVCMTNAVLELPSTGTSQFTTRTAPAEINPARASRLPTAAGFHQLADVPPEIEWFANISNPNARRVYGNAIRDFMRFTGIARPVCTTTKIAAAQGTGSAATMRRRGLRPPADAAITHDLVHGASPKGLDL
jgi:hypothetical protein